MEAYLDNSATTRVCPQAAAAVMDAMTENWGNPSSLHKRGLMAQEILDSSREALAKRLSCRSDEIFFTSGGTESNNLALLGAAWAQRRAGKRIVISSVEHSSIEQSAKQLESEGFEVVRVPVDSRGRISVSELQSAITSGTVLVSIMAVNNETGTVQPIEAVKRAVLAVGSNAVIHCDAVQAFGKIDIRPTALGIDLLSVSAHKIHGPKGVGALYVKNGMKKDKRATKISPRTFGGLQEKALRPGTEPVPAIAGFGAAVRALPDTVNESEKMSVLRDELLRGLSEIEDIEINSPPDALPYITNISVVGINSEPMLNFLSSKGIYVSSGSACAKGQKSRVLKSMGLSDARISSSLRISFSRFTTLGEVYRLLDALREGRSTIRTSKR